jgi:uncharacterized repeat protein (TIGR01451 family)
MPGVVGSLSDHGFRAPSSHVITGEVVAVLRPSRVISSVLPRRAIVGLFATFASIVLLPCGVALADTVTTNFEPPLFHTGSVNGQDGWKSGNPGPTLPQGYDQAVVNNASPSSSPAPPAPAGPAAFGTQSLRISNAYGTAPDTFPPEFELQTYSKPVAQPAGEHLDNTEFTAQFSFISVFPTQQPTSGCTLAPSPCLRISVSPDNGHGARMSYIGLDDLADGIHVIFYDTPDPNDPTNFVSYDLATLSRTQVHTIRFWMRLIPGTNNDLVRILIDGQDAGQCFTTWENYYRGFEHHEPAPSDRLLFLSGNRDGNRLALLGGGYLFDNVTTTTGAAGPPGCDLTIDKTPDSPTVTAGGVAGYQITMHNRGRLAARNLLLCDRIPRRTTFVSASRKLRRVGNQRCLTIPRLGPGKSAGFHINLHVASDAPAGNLPNIADILPDETPGLPGQPPLSSVSLPDLPANVAAAIAAAPPITKVKVLVKILRAIRTAPPPVTG